MDGPCKPSPLPHSRPQGHTHIDKNFNRRWSFIIPSTMNCELLQVISPSSPFTLSNIFGDDEEEHPVLCAEDPFTSPKDREKLTQIMFETFNVPCYLSKPHNCLTMAASGNTSGLSVDFGEDGVNIVPIYECIVDPPSSPVTLPLKTYNQPHIVV